MISIKAFFETFLIRKAPPLPMFPSALLMAGLCVSASREAGGQHAALNAASGKLSVPADSFDTDGMGCRLRGMALGSPMS